MALLTACKLAAASFDPTLLVRVISLLYAGLMF